MRIISCLWISLNSFHCIENGQLLIGHWKDDVALYDYHETKLNPNLNNIYIHQ